MTIFTQEQYDNIHKVGEFIFSNIIANKPID